MCSCARSPAPWLPTVLLLFAASLWGLSWWPLKQFAAQGLSGPLLAFVCYGAVGLIGLPALWRERLQWRPQWGLLAALAVIGGWANAAFVTALVLGDVVRVMLLFYLSPLWSVIGGRMFLGERVSRRRAAAVVLALAGALLVIGGAAALTQPLGLADLLALSGGVAFAGNNILSRAGQAIPTPSKTVAVFVGCAFAAAALLTIPGAASVPALRPGAGLALAAYAFGWLVLATATWQYGVTHMESGRAGVILVSELLVALLSAVLIGGAQLAPREWLGSALILAAALLEATEPSPHSSRETA